MTSYTNVFGGTVIYPAEVSYRAFSLSANTQLAWPTELATDTNVVSQIMDVTPTGAGFSILMPAANDVSVGETTLLNSLARQVGITLHSAQINEALQLSRERLVTAREEERRRMRRDLHDGLGPTLAGLHLQLGSLRRVVYEDPVRRRASLRT